MDSEFEKRLNPVSMEIFQERWRYDPRDGFMLVHGMCLILSPLEDEEFLDDCNMLRDVALERY